MDPISITGTLIAVLQVTTTVISICYDYRQGVSSASREVLLDERIEEFFPAPRVEVTAVKLTTIVLRCDKI